MSHEGIGAFSPKVGESYTRGGGPAFPVLDNLACVLYGGMTLRDYFAAKAMCGFLGNASEFTSGEQMAQDAYLLANAMLAAREA